MSLTSGTSAWTTMCLPVYCALFHVPNRSTRAQKSVCWRILFWSVLNFSNNICSFCVLMFSSVQFSRSVVSNSSLPHESQHARPPCHHQLPDFIQSHVHRVSDAIQPAYPLSSPSPPAPKPSQHQRLFQWVNSLHEVAKVLEFQL